MMTMMQTVTLDLAGRTLTLETGRLAKQAGGAVLVRYGDTVVLASATVAHTETEKDFFPLMVDYREKTYAAGRIPGGFFKREGRPNEKEVLSSRLIDRSLRPLFNQEMRFEIQVTAEVLSSDQENDGDTLGLIGASCAINLSDMPFPGPLAAVRIGLGEDGFILNPTSADLETSRMNIVLAGTADSIVMVEGEAREISEEQLVEAFRFAQPFIQEIVRLQAQLVTTSGKAKRSWEPKDPATALTEIVQRDFADRVRTAIRTPDKHEREAAMRVIEADAAAALAESHPDSAPVIRKKVGEMEKSFMRRMIL
jgi:polyribonucleotide nucleotidyltransferase